MTARLRRLASHAAGERGQSSVELVAMLPLLLAAGAVTFEGLAAGAAHELAGHAAEAGAMALVEGAAPEPAVRAALPGWSVGRLRVRVAGGRVTVQVVPPLPVRPLARLLTATATADVGAVP